MIVLFCGFNTARADPNDFVIDGTLPFGDVPTVYVLLSRNPAGPALFDPEEDYLSVYFDTGASGILLSRETREYIGVAAEPGAQFADVGVGGEELFDVSEPLYVSLADNIDPFELPVLGDYQQYSGPWRFQLTRDYVEGLLAEPIDVVGIPGMMGKSVVLGVGVVELLGLEIPYYTVQIKEPNDPAIPEPDIEIKTRFTDFLYKSHPSNTGQLPVLSYNPVIEGIVSDFGTNVSTGDWLLDTGAQLSMISSAQGQALGLVDAQGEPIVEPEFYQQLGGIGSEITAPVFIIDSLTVPTMGGFNLVYENAYVAVFDIGFVVENTGEAVILDGIFGANLLGYSYLIVGELDFVIALSPFSNIIFNTEKATLGFVVDDIYPAPVPVENYCGGPDRPWQETDITRDCSNDIEDLLAVTLEWLSSDCDMLNWYCGGCDISKDGKVNISDMAHISTQWLKEY